VQSTLILSRSDGSIIRATGFEEAPVISLSQPITAADQSKGAQEATAYASNGQQDLKPAESLAASIYQFVQNAASLGKALGTTSRSGSGSRDSIHGYGGRAQSANKPLGQDDEVDAANNEDDVQLLRLRTKQQEIIIFPDPSYICCVVQRKTAGAAERR
jgi:hypothetical protein